MTQPRRGPLALLGGAVALAVCIGALLGSGRGNAEHEGWWRAGQANLAGWAAYEGSLDAGADLARAVLDLDLHVVGVAEACQQQLQEAERRLARHGPVEVVFHRTVRPDQRLPYGAASDDECVYGLGVIVRGPLALTETSTSELPTLDGDPGGHDREEDRHVVCGRVAKADRVGEHVLACTTHFTRLMAVEERRRLQAEHLVVSIGHLASRSTPVLVLADLNARSGSSDLEPIYDSGLRDVGAGDSRDHILVRGLDASRLRARDLGRSDHHLIWTTVAPPG